MHGALSVEAMFHDERTAVVDLLVSIEQRPIRGVGDLFAGLPRTSIGAPQQLRLLRHNEILTTAVTPVDAPRAAA